MIDIEVKIPIGVDKFAWNHAYTVCNHVRQQGIAGDIEWYAQEEITATLIEQTIQTTLWNTCSIKIFIGISIIHILIF